MTKVTFERAFNLLDIDMADFLGGNVNIGTFSSTNIDIADGNFSAKLTGENFAFGFPPTGTVHEVDAFFKGGGLFSASDMDVDLSELYANRNDTNALLDQFFGGDDQFKGSRGSDVLAGYNGDDKINGAKGADHLYGGAGADTLTGGQGGDIDTFHYGALSDSTKKSADLITDLGAEDFIDISMLDVTKLKVTAVYNEAKDLTAFSIDINGDHRADLVINALGNHTDFAHFIA